MVMPQTATRTRYAVMLTPVGTTPLFARKDDGAPAVYPTEEQARLFVNLCLIRQRGYQLHECAMIRCQD